MKSCFLLILISMIAMDLAGQTSSDIPLVVIETPGGMAIPDEPKIRAHMKIIDHGPGWLNLTSDPGNIYDGLVGIEIRGAYSASLPQKPYGFETRDSAGANLNVSLMGMPEENDWILLANYNDKSFLRNSLAGYLFREMGHYAPRTKHVELVLNGSYEGIYVLTEKIKRDKGRVDIATLNPDENSGDDLTGGYIFKNDYYSENDSWESAYPPFTRPEKSVRFVYYYPKPDEITEAQKQYLQDWVFGFETVLHGEGFMDRQTGYAAYIDENSFRDYFILSEVTRNVDAYKKSRYFYKDKESNGGKLHSGPPWDFDWAWKDIWDCPIFANTDGSGWAYQVNDCEVWPTPPVYMTRLLQDETFTGSIKQRYEQIRESFMSDASLDHYIDSVTMLLQEAQVRHYERWDILGENVGAPEVGQIPDTFEGEMIKFKNWIRTRLDWLDQHMPGDLDTPLPEERSILRLFPNPASTWIRVESNRLLDRIELTTLTGAVVFIEEDLHGNAATLQLPALSSGVYLMHLFFKGDERISRKLFIE
jgi:hypothetical protein